jgi:hypothetical protein
MRNANTVTCHSRPALDQRDHRASARERMGARQRHVRGQVLDGSNRYREAGVDRHLRPTSDHHLPNPRLDGVYCNG